MKKLSAGDDCARCDGRTDGAEPCFGPAELMLMSRRMATCSSSKVPVCTQSMQGCLLVCMSMLQVIATIGIGCTLMRLVWETQAKGSNHQGADEAHSACLSS